MMQIACGSRGISVFDLQDDRAKTVDQASPNPRGSGQSALDFRLLEAYLEGRPIILSKSKET